MGRVVCEVEGGSLNDTAVVLEGDSHISEGGRAQLDLSQLQTYRLFPGQVRDGDAYSIRPSASCSGATVTALPVLHVDGRTVI